MHSLKGIKIKIMMCVASVIDGCSENRLLNTTMINSRELKKKPEPRLEIGLLRFM